MNVEEYTLYIERLRARRRSNKEAQREAGRFRGRLNAKQREAVLRKTDGRCHICGGEVGEKWQADHVLSLSGGGRNGVDNFLAAHATCNNYRWDYAPEEFQEILKLGVWVRTQIERKTTVGREVAERFISHEKRRTRRRKVSPSSGGGSGAA
jgi:5-methylcytosine-specific restriction endonuclease McrA